MKKLFFWPDTHVPYEDPTAFRVALKALEILKPDYLICLGDFADFYAISDHDKDVRRRHDFQDELVQANIGLRKLERAAGANAIKIFCIGNHENRLERFLQRQTPELVDVLVGSNSRLDVDSLLNLSKNGWKVIPYQHLYKVGHLHVTHDTAYCGINAHRQTGAVVQGNVAFGHTHQLIYSVEGNLKGKKHVAISCGWLGDVNAINYKSPAYVARYWSHGFAVGYLRDNGDVHIVPIPIVNGTCVIEGREINL